MRDSRKKEDKKKENKNGKKFLLIINKMKIIKKMTN